MATVGIHYGKTDEGKMYLTHDQLVKRYSKMNKDQQINTLWEALDYMQQYNGRNKVQCVAMAMGYQVDYIEIKGKETEVYTK